MILKKLPVGGRLLAILVFTGCLACGAGADQSQTRPFIQKTGGGGTGCPGAYTGYAQMTNSVGTLWITPPPNATSGTLTDISGLPAPYASVACVLNKKAQTWCDTNSVTFPVTNSMQYQLVIYAKSTSPPTNGQPLTLQVTWQ